MNVKQSEPLTWPTPTGLAASNKVSRAARINHYLATTKTLLANGTSVIPNSETLALILQAWDDFGVEVVISSDSYIVKD
jgi:hypothetical protein